MTAQAGDRANTTGDVACATCGEKVHPREGDKIRTCPTGHSESDSRRNEP